MVNRLTVALQQPEYSALLKVAIADLRTPADQLRYILRTELERRGLLSPEADEAVRQDAEAGSERA